MSSTDVDLDGTLLLAADPWLVDPSLLVDRALAERFREVEQAQRALLAAQASLLSEAERRGAFVEDGHRTVVGWSRVLAQWSGARARSMRRIAHLLDEAPQLRELLACGIVGGEQVEELARVFANPRCGDRLVADLWELSRAAVQQSFEEFRVTVRRWEQEMDVDGAHRSHRGSHRDRRAGIVRVGTSVVVHASGGAVDGAEMREIFERYCDAEFRADCATVGLADIDTDTDSDSDTGAPRRAGLPRTAAQRAWDALHRIFLDAASTRGGAQAPEPVLDVLIDQATFEQLLRDLAHDTPDRSVPVAATGRGGTVDRDLSDPQVRIERSHDPRWWRCETPDGDSLPRAAALEAALIGHVRRVVVDTAGVVVDVGRKRRLFTGVQREMVLRMARWCTHPGCTVPARHCEADHTIDHQHGGTTDTRNGGPRCGPHNRLKNRGYNVWLDPGGCWHTYRPDGTEIT